MIEMYFKIAMVMFVVFALVVWGAPFIIWFHSYMMHVSSGGSFDDFDWEKNYYLSGIDDFLDSIDATTGEERAIASIVIVFLLGLFWIVGIFVSWFFIASLHKNVVNKKYDDATRDREKKDI